MPNFNFNTFKTFGMTFRGRQVKGIDIPFILNARIISKLLLICPENFVLTPPALCNVKTLSMNFVEIFSFSMKRNISSKSAAIFNSSL